MTSRSTPRGKPRTKQRTLFDDSTVMRDVTRTRAPSVGVATSEEAADRIETAKGRMQLNVLYEIVAAGEPGLAAFQVESATSYPGNSVRPRLIELVDAKMIVRTDTTVRTPSGRSAFTYVATSKGRHFVADKVHNATKRVVYNG